MGTIREKTYQNLPLSDAATSLYLKSTSEVEAFAEECGWIVKPDEKRIYFVAADGGDASEIPTAKIDRQTLRHARELERIVLNDKLFYGCFEKNTNSMLTEFSFIIGQPNKQELMIAREILELGAQWSIKTNDISSFERYILQLKTYYNDYKSILPESPRMYPLIGANLLRLLTQNRISEFHTELEQIEDCSNVFIKHPIELEQCLMEGSFGRVWHSRSNIPAEEYKFFVEMLVGTIREEIASCSESTYKELYLSDAATLLYFNTEEEVVKFAKDVRQFLNIPKIST
ncbi:hypothetical protein HK098_004322 [Nowakowskiella sp. JEL0407]|nr:hypothetical protein HK098_004322 [Nowakowskiella sp. JEL0407]